MKEFWLGILKNVITYVVMLVIVIVGGITIVTQKFPPDWAQIRSAIITVKDGYVSMINMRKSMAIPQGIPSAMPDQSALLAQMEEAVDGSASTTAKKSIEPRDLEMQTTLALLKSMSQQMQPQTHTAPAASDEELKKHMQTLVKQNQDMIERMDKIQTYLSGLNQYLIQIAPRQPVHHSAVQQPPPSRQPTAVTPTSAPPVQSASK